MSKFREGENSWQKSTISSKLPMKLITTSNSLWFRKDRNYRKKTEISLGNLNSTTWLLSILFPSIKLQPFSIVFSLTRVMMIGVLSWEIKLLKPIQVQHLDSNSLFVAKEDSQLHVEMIILDIDKTISFRWTLTKYLQQSKTSDMRYLQQFLTTWVWSSMIMKKNKG